MFVFYLTRGVVAFLITSQYVLADTEGGLDH
jgi:hypothetical protein